MNISVAIIIIINEHDKEEKLLRRLTRITTNSKQIETGGTILMISSLSNGSSCFPIVLHQHPARMGSHIYKFSMKFIANLHENG